jgi:hypothetical protein
MAEDSIYCYTFMLVDSIFLVNVSMILSSNIHSPFFSFALKSFETVEICETSIQLVAKSLRSFSVLRNPRYSSCESHGLML